MVALPGYVTRVPLLLFALALGCSLATGCKRSESSGSTAAAAKSTAPAVPAAKSGAAPEAAGKEALLAKMRGRWLRPDGNYVLAINSVDPDGRAEAQYFNPRPINVAWTRVRVENGQVKVECELRDTNYPGCLYKLNYFPETDRLVGTYFQAQMQETHEVAFVRDP